MMRKNHNRGIDTILADMMMVLLVITLLYLVVSNKIEIQKAEESEQKQNAQQESVEMPPGQEHDEADQSGIIIRMYEDNFQVLYAQQTLEVADYQQLESTLLEVAGEEYPEVILVASETERFDKVMHNLERLDAIVTWTTPEVGIMR